MSSQTTSSYNARTSPTYQQVIFLIASQHLENFNMFTSSTLASLLVVAAPLVQLGVAVFPPATDSTVAYLTNCLTSDTFARYSEVSMYADVDQSFAGQNPDQYVDTPLGGWVTWELANPGDAGEMTWDFAGSDPNAPNSFTETIKAGSQDPAVPAFSLAGFGSYMDNFNGGAVAFPFQCFKDNPRVLYTTSDHECSTVYYCRTTHSASGSPIDK